MPTATPPFDRAIALACTMGTLHSRWLHARCGCCTARKPAPTRPGHRASPMWPDWHLPSDTVPLTAAQAQARQDEARARQAWLTLFVGPAGTTDGTVMARAHTADFQGGVLLPGGLVALTLDELRRMMPTGLTLKDRQAGDPTEVIEIWWE